MYLSCHYHHHHLHYHHHLDHHHHIIITFSIELAGNPIIDFKELKRLSQCTYKVKNVYPSQSLSSSLQLTLLGPVLRTLSLSDIHFGRCPIVDENGEEFVEVLR